ncbi:hypothetical protein, partial [Gallibacterium sp. AGMB14963]|uniref:hypothetical protein n=1 Tax=Gallibacterium faecale TaxID=3019086 RepID=UPI0022F1D559
EKYLSFSLKGCRTEKEVKAKVLEWLILSKDLRSNINKYLNTQFTNRDFDLIYEYLGRAVNRDLTLKFINKKFSMDVFDEHK